MFFLNQLVVQSHPQEVNVLPVKDNLVINVIFDGALFFSLRSVISGREGYPFICSLRFKFACRFLKVLPATYLAILCCELLYHLQ